MANVAFVNKCSKFPELKNFHIITKNNVSYAVSEKQMENCHRVLSKLGLISSFDSVYLCIKTGYPVEIVIYLPKINSVLPLIRILEDKTIPVLREVADVSVAIFKSKCKPLKIAEILPGTIPQLAQKLSLQAVSFDANNDKTLQYIKNLYFSLLWQINEHKL